jgi:predicted transposase/invertase (TIGR01784 family)
MQFADIKNDIAFRKIFGNSAKTEILTSFLNAVLKLEGTRMIVSVSILNPYQAPLVFGAKSTILDVKAKDKRGKEYIVEMQLTDKIGFAKRVVYYSAKSYSAQLNVGEDYYKLKPTIFIGILNFEFLETKNYLSRHLILDAETHEHKLKDLDFNFIELPKFNKNESELDTLIDKWIFFIKNAETLAIVPPHADDAGLLFAYKEADQHNWTKADLEAYEYARLRETDDKAEKMLVEEKAKNEEKKQIAKKLLQSNLSDDEISQYTDLSVEEVKQLRANT